MYSLLSLAHQSGGQKIQRVNRVLCKGRKKEIMFANMLADPRINARSYTLLDNIYSVTKWVSSNRKKNLGMVALCARMQIPFTQPMLQVNYPVFKPLAPPVPDKETGCCLGSEGNGLSVGEGGEGGPGPPERGKDKQLVLNKGRDNMGRDDEDQPRQTW